MDQIRYPIGEFKAIQQPTEEERKSWIADIAEIAPNLRQAVQELTTEQLNTPYRSGGWTIRQVIHHMADNDMNAVIRFKKALTEESPIAGSYRQDLWGELEDYKSTPIETSLLLLENLHMRFVTVLNSLSPVEFQRTFKSPAHGEMNLNVAMQRFAWHGQHHTAQIVSLKERLGW